MAEEQTSAHLVESLRHDQWSQWQAGTRITAETYLQQHPALRADAEGTLELLYNEIMIRQQAGEAPRLEEYQARFPQLAARLELLFEVHSVLEAGYPPQGGATGPAPGEASNVMAVPGFEILRELGRGGMSVVYEARQKSLNRTVALKMLLAGSYASAEERARFRTEAEALARLQHPQIVPVHEVGEHDGRPYLVMEYIDGSNLARLLGGSPLPARQAAQLVEQLARAIHYAHQRGIVHRDLKPANVLLQMASGKLPKENLPAGNLQFAICNLQSAIPKITDFGLAKLLRGELAGVSTLGAPTQSGIIIGTPSYMAPEQASGQSREIGPAADTYALGAILYELLTGRPPFRAATPLETLLQVQEVEPEPPGRLCPHLPEDLATICLKCLEKEPRKRYASAEALADDLNRFLAGQPIQARPVAALGRTWRWCRRKPGLATLLAVVGLLVAAITVISLVSALWLGREAAKSQRAEREAKEQLFHLSLAKARALRESGRMGQRFENLKLLKEAAAIARALRLNPDDRLALRREAIACLALVDLGIQQQWETGTLWSSGVDFDAPLERCAWVDARGTIHVERVADHQEMVCLPGTGDIQVCLQTRLSPNGCLLAVQFLLNDHSVRTHVWDLAAPRGPRPLLTGRIEMHHGFSPDGRWFAFNRPDGSVGLRELATGKEKHLGMGLWAHRLAFRPDGRQVAVSSLGNERVTLLDVDSGAVLAELAHPGEAHSLAWSQDGRLLAAGCIDTKVYVWDVPAQRQQAVLEGHQQPANVLAFHPRANLLASSGIEGITRLWDPVSGRQLVKAPGTAVRFSLAGGRLAFHDELHLGVWQVADGRECRLLHHGRFGNRMPWLGYKGPESAEFSPDGRLLASAGEDGVRLWDREGGPISHLCIGRQETVVFHPSGTSLFTYGRTGLQRWPIQAPPEAGSARLQIGPPQALEVPPNRSVFRACCSRDGQWLAVNDHAGRRVFVVRVDKPTQRTVISNCPDIHSIALSPDGRWLAIGQGNKADGIGIFESAAGRLVRRLPERQHFGIAALAFSPDGRWLVVGGLSDYRLYAVPSWESGPVFPRERRGIWAGPMTFSRDGRTLALAHSLQQLQLFDLETRQEMATLLAPNAEFVQWVCFSPDGRQLAVVTQNHVIQLWDLHALRHQLAALGLDWDLPPYPAPKPSPRSGPKVAILHRIIEAEYCVVAASANCDCSIQDMDPWGRQHWSNGHQLLCSSRKSGFVEFEVFLPRTGRYTLEVCLTRAPNYGLVEISLDGQKVGKLFDGFHDRGLVPTRVPLGVVQLAAGRHRLRFTVVDKNLRSVNYFMGIDYLALTSAK
jgi:serine/threonine protein kinase/WD40 repeat protein